MKESPVTDEEVRLLGGTISHETNLMYLLARCIDTMMADIESRMRRVNRTFSIKGEVKKRLKEYTHIVEQAGAQFRNFVEPQIMMSCKEDWKEFEKGRVFANELIRLLMLYYETCLKNNGHHIEVFKLLETFIGDRNVGAFEVEDINRFDLGCREKYEN